MTVLKIKTCLFVLSIIKTCLFVKEGQKVWLFLLNPMGKLFISDVNVSVKRVKVSKTLLVELLIFLLKGCKCQKHCS